MLKLLRNGSSDRRTSRLLVIVLVAPFIVLATVSRLAAGPCDDALDKWIANQPDSARLNAAFEKLPTDDSSLRGAQRVFDAALDGDVAKNLEEILERLETPTIERLLQRADSLNNPQVSHGISIYATTSDGGFVASKFVADIALLDGTPLDDSLFRLADQNGFLFARTNPGAGVAEAAPLFTPTEGVVSPNGLLYRAGGAEGNRVSHVLKHSRPDGPGHSYFTLQEPAEVFILLDDASLRKERLRISRLFRS